MEEVANTSIVDEEPQKLELSSDFSKEVRESIAHATRLVVEDIFHETSFWWGKNRVLESRKVYRFFFDYEITAPRIGQVPEQPTQMQEKQKTTFANQAPFSGWLLWLPDRRALHPSGAWPTLTTNRSNMNRSLH